MLKEVSRGLLHLHNQQISHRDLKIENVLLQGKQFKLCDFGSSWRQTTLPLDCVDERFEDYDKYTTMMYRPPEMIDKYKNWAVTSKVDIWVRSPCY